MKKFIIPLLTVVTVVSIIFAGCAPAPEPKSPPPWWPIHPEAPSSPPEAPTTTAPPKPGEWTASTGTSEFTFTFNVSSDSTSIEEFHYELAVSAGVLKGLVVPRLPIIGGQFTFDTETWAPWRPWTGPGLETAWDMVIQGEFDETGRHASGTWEISADGTTCQAGTWEASAP